MLFTPLQDHKDKQRIRLLMPGLLAGMEDRATVKGWSPRSLASALVDVNQIIRGEPAPLRAAVLDDSVVLLYEVCEAWWLSGPVLVEYSLLPYQNTPGRKARVFEAIDQLAASEGATSVVLGSVGSDNEVAFSRLLRTNGYRPSSPQFIKRLD